MYGDFDVDVRSFIVHEHLDNFGLINMNGRVYDPMLGMFLSPDNYVQMPDFTQNFNRYGYALNNPLIYTDPSGEWIWAVPMIVGGGLNMISNWDHISAGDNFWQKLGRGAGYFGAGAANTGLSMYGGVTGSLAGGFIQGSVNSLIQGDPLDIAVSEGFIGLGTNAIGYGVGSTIKNYTDVGLRKIGVLNKWVRNISMNVTGTVSGSSASLYFDAIWHGASHEKAIKGAFNIKTVAGSVVLGTAIGIYETKYFKPDPYDGYNRNYYGEPTPLDPNLDNLTPSADLQLDKLPKSRIKPMPPMEPFLPCGRFEMIMDQFVFVPCGN